MGQEGGSHWPPRAAPPPAKATPGAGALRFHNDAAKRRVSPSFCSPKPPTRLKSLSINLLNTKD